MAASFHDESRTTALSGLLATHHPVALHYPDASLALHLPVLQFGVLFGSLAIISLGTGGIKPNVSAFGADQFDESDPQDQREKQSFFNWCAAFWILG